MTSVDMTRIVANEDVTSVTLDDASLTDKSVLAGVQNGPDTTHSTIVLLTPARAGSKSTIETVTAGSSSPVQTPSVIITVEAVADGASDAAAGGAVTGGQAAAEPLRQLRLAPKKAQTAAAAAAAAPAQLLVQVGSDAVGLLVDDLEGAPAYRLTSGGGGGGGDAADSELLELVERGADGQERPLETVREVSLVDIRAVCEACGCAISHHMVGLLARQDGSEYGYRCRICQNVFAAVGDMALHMDSHRPPGDTQCRFCTRGLRAFRRPASASQFSCQACPETFATRQQLIRHRQVHPVKERYPCELCNKAFQMKVQLEVHVRSHLGHKPYSCDLCPATFVQPSHLINHRRTHTGERPYSCGECGRAFVQQGHLVAHQRTHTGERPYTCDVCRRGFTQSGQLSVHRKLHESDSPYRARRRRGEPAGEFRCAECRKQFRAAKDLRRHELVHGSAAHECRVCGSRFKRPDHLKRHLRSHEKAPRRGRLAPGRPPGPGRRDDDDDDVEARGLALLDGVIDSVLDEDAEHSMKRPPQEEGAPPARGRLRPGGGRLAAAAQSRSGHRRRRELMAEVRLEPLDADWLQEEPLTEQERDAAEHQERPAGSGRAVWEPSDVGWTDDEQPDEPESADDLSEEEEAPRPAGRRARAAPPAAPSRVSHRSSAGNRAALVGVCLTRTRGRPPRR